MKGFHITAIAAIERWLLRMDRARSGLALFAALAPLFLLMLAPTEFNGNEENYFQLGYQRVAPEQFTESHAIFDRSKARIVSETILGTSVKWLGYESAHAALRIFLALLYASGLALFFSAISIGVIEALLIIAVFRAMGEQLIGAEWLFKGIEPKTLAYGLLFVAFGLACRRRWAAAMALSAAATALHFLVGGFWSLMLLLFQVTQDKAFKPVLRSAVLFAVMVAPLMVVVVPHDVVSLVAPRSGELTADVIYSQLRAPEHMAPFVGLYSFWAWLPGVVVILSLLGVLAGLHLKRLLPPFAIVPMLGLLYLLLALVIAFFDRHTNYFGKFYLFRPSSLALFFAITVIVLAVRRPSSDDARWALVLVSTAFVAVDVFGILKTQIDIIRRAPAIPYERELVDAIERHSAPGDIVLLEPFNEMNAEFERLHRVIPRPTLVSWKFTPTNPSEILRWYDLIQRRERLFASGCAEPMQPPVKLLVIFHRDVADKMRGCGEPVWQHGEAALVRVRAP